MRGILKVLLTASCVLAAVAFAVFGAGDREFFTPPPESIAEGYMRSLASKRYEPARRFLAEEARAATDQQKMRRIGEEMESRIGQIMDVRGENPRIDDSSSAQAETRLELADRQTTDARFEFRFERGMWRIVNPQPTFRADAKAR
jgi:hypothetical protein